MPDNKQWIERLRFMGKGDTTRAADTIERLEAELDRLAKETSFEPGHDRQGGLPGEKATVVDHVLEQFVQVGEELRRLEKERERDAAVLEAVRRKLNCSPNNDQEKARLFDRIQAEIRAEIQAALQHAQEQVGE